MLYSYLEVGDSILDGRPVSLTESFFVMSFVSFTVSNCYSLTSSNWMIANIVNDLERMCKEAFVA